MKRLGGIVAGFVLSGSAVACELPPEQHLVVTITEDAASAAPGDGVCEATAGAGDCTLRAAIQEANAAEPGTRTTIHLAPDETYVVDLPGLDDAGAVGDLDVHADVEILGNGARLRTEDGVTTRLLEHHGGRLRIVDATLSGQTDRDGLFGAVSDGGSGGAVLNHAHLELTDVVITFSRSDSGGAAVHQTAGSLVLRSSRVTGNRPMPFGDPWAAIHLVDGVAAIIDSEISDNWFVNYYENPDHAAIRQEAGTLVLAGSTVSNNGSNIRPSQYVLEPNGWGLEVNGTAHIVGSTVVRNRGTGSTWGWGPGDVVGSGTVYASGSVLGLCGLTATSNGHNADDNGSCLGAGSSTDLVGIGWMLGDLGFNGGPTRSHVPLAGSAIVDAVPIGAAGICDGTRPADQRGEPRPSGVGCDIGSVERQPGDA